MSVTLETLRDYLAYDAATGEFRWLRNPGKRPWAGKPAGQVRKDGYVRIGVGGVHYHAHRLAWFLSYGSFPPEFIDHINGDKADNRLSNLRPATRTQNCQNRRGAKLDLPKGVFAVPTQSGPRYRARIGAAKARFNIGVFDTVAEAQSAYAAAAIELHGEFARLAPTQTQERAA